MGIWLKLILTVLQNETICTQIGSPSEFQWTKTAGGALSSTPSLELLQRQLHLPPINRGGARECVNASLTLQSRCSEGSRGASWKVMGNPGDGSAVKLLRVVPALNGESTAMTQGGGMRSILLFSAKHPCGNRCLLAVFLGGGWWYLSRLLRKHGPNPLISQLGCIHHILSGAGAWADGGLWSGYPDHEHASWMWPFSDSDSGPAIRQELGGAQSYDS